MSLFVDERDVAITEFAEYRYIPMLDQENGCLNGCRCGILEYTQMEYIQGGVHEDQEVFYVLEGCGAAIVGEQEMKLTPGVCFIVPPGHYHAIKRSPDCSAVRLFFFHAAV